MCIPRRRLYKMTTTVTDKPLVTLEATENCTLVWDAGDRRCVFSRFWKWLWSGRGIGDPETHNYPRSLSQDPINSSREPIHYISAGQIRSSEDLPENMPCRACQSKGMECDLRKPRCSQCLDEQILCFYIVPLRFTMTQSKKQRFACA